MSGFVLSKNVTQRILLFGDYPFQSVKYVISLSFVQPLIQNLIISAVIAFVNQYVAYRITKCSIFDNLGVVICDSADETAAINLRVSSK